MFTQESSPFGEIIIPSSTKVIFVSDLFVEDYVGGAELTSQALIDSSPFEIFKLHSKDVTIKLLQDGFDKHWIFGNFTQLNPQLIPSIVGNLRYSILEYDYKYCRVRSPEKHFHTFGSFCDCHNQMNGKIISAFFYGAMSLWWMSEKQMERYHTMFPFLAERDNIVLSSVFDDLTLGKLKFLRNTAKSSESKWIVLGSDSWIKGFDAAKKWCEDTNKEYEILWNLPYDEMLTRLAHSAGLVYLPSGGDTCPRLVIEAKLLGIPLQLNENVQHKDEEWFNTHDLEAIEGYLHTSKTRFWNAIKKIMNYRPTISGYTTTYNCVWQDYPFKQSIKSMLQFCDEVCIVDGGSTDSTLEQLAWLAFPEYEESTSRIKTSVIMGLCHEARYSKQPFEFPEILCGEKRDPRIRVKVVHRDWMHPRSSVFDGAQKAEARAMCTKEFCWQMDSDEIVHEDDAQKILDLCVSMPRSVNLISLPVIEYWGGYDKTRIDVQPWKWRLSRNDLDITHGIPVELRKFDKNGDLYASHGTDGCDYINKSSGTRVTHMSFHTLETENLRRAALIGDKTALESYEAWFNEIVTNLPTVFHYSWCDLVRKIKLYRDFWSRHWSSLYSDDPSMIHDQNMMFDVPWSEVTDKMIEEKAKELKTIGGWVWHSSYDGTKTPWINCVRTQPIK